MCATLQYGHDVQSTHSTLYTVDMYILVLFKSLSSLHCRSEGATPYIIPAGGSNEIGVWGYIEAFRELMEQVTMYKITTL